MSRAVSATSMIKARAKDWRLVPGPLRLSLQMWVTHGVKPGGFLSAVLRNDLSGAVAAADHDNALCIVGLVRFLQAYCPAESWGSLQKVESWGRARALGAAS